MPLPSLIIYTDDELPLLICKGQRWVKAYHRATVYVIVVVVAVVVAVDVVVVVVVITDGYIAHI